MRSEIVAIMKTNIEHRAGTVTLVRWREETGVYRQAIERQINVLVIAASEPLESLS